MTGLKRGRRPLYLLGIIVVFVLVFAPESQLATEGCEPGTLDCQVTDLVAQVQAFLEQSFMGFPLWLILIVLLGLALLIAL